MVSSDMAKDVTVPRQVSHLDSALSSASRLRSLAELRDGAPVDVLVIGGGVTGAGAALDAASRGLRTALVERRDLAWGTSRWSSKLVHGGLRYLAQGAVGTAMESARERDVLLRTTAPHLVRPIRQMIPLTPQVSRSAEAKTDAGLRAGDGLRRAARTPATDLPRTRRLDVERTLALAPGLRRDGLRGSLTSWDAQLEDDARLVVGLARTAAAHGALVATRCGAVSAAGDGARLRDELTGEEFDVRARAVINATGVWTSALAPELALRPSRGSHVVVDQSALGPLPGITNVPVPGSSSRFVFAIPQRSGLTYVGLTDEEVRGAIPDVPTAPDEDVDFLLETISSAFARPLTRADVLGTYAGLRPLVDRGEGHTADLSRSHVVQRGDDGLVTVVGGKLTTYRRMAEDAVDAAVDGFADAGPCRTRELPLVGAAPRLALAILDAPSRLIDRHGTQAPAVLALAGGDPELLAPLVPGRDVLAVEVLHAVRAEGALDVDDVLDRRTRLGLVPADRAIAEPRVAELVDHARSTMLVA
jgi:glycerol-3-phosphate dehydrogenase